MRDERVPLTKPAGCLRSKLGRAGSARQCGYPLAVLLLAILGLGLFAGAVAQLVLGTGVYEINWAEAIVAGLLGSFVGGMLASILAGDGIKLRASGIIGSIVGAIVVSVAYRWYRGRRRIA
jgi:uncharacterized membrane protein YeaQ/YmgE (transglycosylase-associated protein family)